MVLKVWLGSWAAAISLAHGGRSLVDEGTQAAEEDTSGPPKQEFHERDAFYVCASEGHHCDLRRNLRSVVTFESQWAMDYLNGLTYDNVMFHLGFFKKLHTFIAEELQSLPGKENCPNIILPKDWLKNISGTNTDPYNFGKLAANFWNSPKVGFYNIAAQGFEPDHLCSWREILKPHIMRVQTLVRNESKWMMWSMKKGRGDTGDKVATILEIDKAAVTDGMRAKWDKVYDATVKHDKEHPNYYKHMTANQQRTLPGVIRWAQTVQNAYFGTFVYGEGLPGYHSKAYFHEEVVHGAGKFVRNLDRANPADRMLRFGIPWIGGISGTILDIYLLARHLGYTGNALAYHLIIVVASLVAGSQHSLGELLMALAHCEMIDATGLKSIDTDVPVQGRLFSYVKKHNSARHFFATPNMKAMVAKINLPKDSFYDWLRAGNEKAGFNLYIKVLEEFVVGTHRSWKPHWRPFDLRTVWESFNIQMEPKERDLSSHLSKCITIMPKAVHAGEDFRQSVFRHGGYKDLENSNAEEVHAWRHWSSDGIYGLDAECISLIAIVNNVQRLMAPRWTLYGEIAHASASTTSSQEWMGQQQKLLFTMLNCVVEMDTASTCGQGHMSKHAFTTFYKISAVLHHTWADDMTARLS